MILPLFCRYSRASADSYFLLQILPLFCRYSRASADSYFLLQILPLFCRYSRASDDSRFSLSSADISVLALMLILIIAHLRKIMADEHERFVYYQTKNKERLHDEQPPLNGFDKLFF
ncbi:hypothetical protein [Lentibacillus sp. CBA3610]|uniref:hypothetical protein n=1 Tax=Lentibacillus sp. CBA3610 TaxID=2518176 RepID=UPI00159612ED|nr:hypothetical protein [Lentibacillus sp. CBA3610]QKY68567.1 hypothetical protein Len3610_02095 [Lentibacillus sp. CBA3610]